MAAVTDGGPKVPTKIPKGAHRNPPPPQRKMNRAERRKFEKFLRSPEGIAAAKKAAKARAKKKAETEAFAQQLDADLRARAAPDAPNVQKEGENAA